MVPATLQSNHAIVCDRHEAVKSKTRGEDRVFADCTGVRGFFVPSTTSLRWWLSAGGAALGVDGRVSVSLGRHGEIRALA